MLQSEANEGVSGPCARTSCIAICSQTSTRMKCNGAKFCNKTCKNWCSFVCFVIVHDPTWFENSRLHIGRTLVCLMCLLCAQMGPMSSPQMSIGQINSGDQWVNDKCCPQNMLKLSSGVNFLMLSVDTRCLPRSRCPSCSSLILLSTLSALPANVGWKRNDAHNRRAVSGHKKTATSYESPLE